MIAAVPPLIRRTAVAALLSVAFASTVQATASAAVALGTIGGNPCDAPRVTWRIGYRLYWRDDAGNTTDRAALPAVEKELRTFLNRFQEDTNCVLAVEVAVWDMQDAVWPSGLTQSHYATPPDDQRTFLAAHDYDSAFYRVPAHGGEGYAGITNRYDRALTPWTIFTVDPSGRSYPYDPPNDPWNMLMFHEFMHQIVGFYAPLQGWPTGDVHAGASYGYTDNPYVNEAYFAAMLQGRVRENGARKGMLPADYIVQGTPAHRVRWCRVPTLSGLTLARAKRRVRAAHCRLGSVRGRGRVVKRQSPRPGANTWERVELSVR